jgi:ABC-type dipeptide/oligopeptide/nickel transport system ATPase component
MTPDQPLLEISGLSIDLLVDHELRRVVHGTDLVVREGEALGIVGESGSGKSMTGRAIMRLLPEGAKVDGGLSFDGRSVYEMDRAALRDYRASEVAVIHQDPRSHINPVRTVGDYLLEGVIRARGWDRKRATEVGISTLSELGIPNPQGRMNQYPHELSGGCCSG